jgi:membrane-bound lytic murein transglycosylase D
MRQETFRSNFLPPSAPQNEVEEAAAASAPATTDPPALTVAAVAHAREIPNFLLTPPVVPPRPQLDQRIRRADEAFEAGRRLYQEGDVDAARVQFDRAIEMLLASPESAPDRLMMEKKLEVLVDRIHRYDVEGMGAGEGEEAFNYDKSPLKEILELTFPIDPSLKNKVLAQVAATVSQLPLEWNDEVLRYINFFSSDRGKRTLISGLQRSGRYRDMILRVLSEEGVPQELIFLAQAESGFLPRALSHKAAAGMWQFVAWRGNEYGLTQTPYADERLDPEKATRAAARHLRDLFHQLGDWYLAMAAYNCGPGCVSRAVERTGFADFWELRRRNALPRETTNYVPLIVAMTLMVKNPGDYGIEGVSFDPPLQYDAVEMTSATSLPLAADLLDVPVTSLRELNPALLRDVAPAGYALRVPKGNALLLRSALEPIPVQKRASGRTHRVQGGETLASIAKRYRTTTANLLPISGNSGEALQSGDLLLVPAAPVVVKKKVRTAARKPVRKVATSAKKPVRKPAAASTKRPAVKRGASVAARVR